MTLKEILDTTPNLNTDHFIGTDKSSTHDYIDQFYENAFKKYQKYTKLSLLEIGVQAGGSLYPWRKYFTNGKVYGIDIIDNVKDEWKVLDNVEYIIQDAYDINFIKSLPQYDIIIDDGPHTLESQIVFIDNYLDKLNNEGLLIIEDIQELADAQILYNRIPEHLKSQSEIIDLRSYKNRYDDLLLVINK